MPASIREQLGPFVTADELTGSGPTLEATGAGAQTPVVGASSFADGRHCLKLEVTTGSGTGANGSVSRAYFPVSHIDVNQNGNTGVGGLGKTNSFRRGVIAVQAKLTAAGTWPSTENTARRVDLGEICRSSSTNQAQVGYFRNASGSFHGFRAFLRDATPNNKTAAIDGPITEDDDIELRYVASTGATDGTFEVYLNGVRIDGVCWDTHNVTENVSGFAAKAGLQTNNAAFDSCLVEVDIAAIAFDNDIAALPNPINRHLGNVEAGEHGDLTLRFLDYTRPQQFGWATINKTLLWFEGAIGDWPGDGAAEEGATIAGDGAEGFVTAHAETVPSTMARYTCRFRYDDGGAGEEFGELFEAWTLPAADGSETKNIEDVIIACPNQAGESRPHGFDVVMDVVAEGADAVRTLHLQGDDPYMDSPGYDPPYPTEATPQAMALHGVRERRRNLRDYDRHRVNLAFRRKSVRSDHDRMWHNDAGNTTSPSAWASDATAVADFAAPNNERGDLYAAGTALMELIDRPVFNGEMDPALYCRNERIGHVEYLHLDTWSDRTAASFLGAAQHAAALARCTGTTAKAFVFVMDAVVQPFAYEANQHWQGQAAWRTQRTALFDALQANTAVESVVIYCGDRHMFLLYSGFTATHSKIKLVIVPGAYNNLSVSWPTAGEGGDDTIEDEPGVIFASRQGATREPGAGSPGYVRGFVRVFWDQTAGTCRVRFYDGRAINPPGDRVMHDHTIQAWAVEGGGGGSPRRGRSRGRGSLVESIMLEAA